MAVEYVSKTTAYLYWNKERTRKRTQLLWGDRATVRETDGSVKKVHVRGRTGWVHEDDLGGESLLEVYFIDVGQGDGVLIRTPDHKHILIDGGWPWKSQPTGKNAIDFVDWKFVCDYGMDSIDLDAVICSHNDQDHYGGLWDMFDRDNWGTDSIEASAVNVEAFYHAGLSWWEGPGGRTLGPVAETDAGQLFTRLLEDRASVEAALPAGANPRVQGEWRQFLEQAVTATKKSGAPTPFERLSHTTGHLPGFSGSGGGVAVKVLAPVEFDVDGEPAIRRFTGGDSKNTNGNSVLLRLDYGKARIILTGDLNKKAQDALLRDYMGDWGEFACDVAKACHHGADDVSATFLRQMRPAATVISSGDSEGHDHPRPVVLGATGITALLGEKNDEITAPFIFSTELARSVGIGKPVRVDVLDSDGEVKKWPGTDDLMTWTGKDLAKIRVTYEETKAGDRNATTDAKTLDKRPIVSGLVYGLINVRTDGKTILCAALNEKHATWNVETFDARF